MDYQTTRQVTSPSPEEARDRLRHAADQVELGAVVRGVGVKFTLGALAAGVILGASPTARRATMQGVKGFLHQVRMMRGTMS